MNMIKYIIELNHMITLNMKNKLKVNIIRKFKTNLNLQQIQCLKKLESCLLKKVD